MVEVQLLTVSDLDMLIGSGGNRKDPQFEGLVIDLLQQAQVTLDSFVAFVDLSGSLLLNDLADHLCSVNDHAEITDARSSRYRERVKSLHNSLFGVMKHLADFRDRDSIIDHNGYFMLLDFEDSTKSAVGNQKP